MSGIYGWIASGLEVERATRALAQMLDCEWEDLGREAVVANGAAIAARRGLYPVELHRRGSLVAALHGRADWNRPELEAIASSQGSAAALAEAYRRYGNDCVLHMHGPCAIAVLDPEVKTALLAIDRMGIRTLCYANPPGELLFAPDAAAVAAHPAVGRRLSTQAVFNYLYCHVVPSPGTIYAGIEKLQPGECVVFREGVAQKRFYWQLRYADDEHEALDALQARFLGLLRDAAKRAVDGDAEIGAFLSGGTDSSTVTGLLTELRGKPVRTYSIGFAAKGFDEMHYARLTARHFQTQAREYYVTPQDVVDAIPLVAQAYDEPFGNASAVPSYSCAKLAREDGVKVLLAGDGGDEIFGGNVRYAKQMLLEGYQALPAPLRRVLQIAPLPKLKSYVQQASIPLPDRLESYNFLHRAPLTEIFEPGFLAEVDPAQPLAWQRTAYERTASSSPVNRMMNLDLKFTLADNDLRKVSRMAELAGVEVRYPLLDEALVEFAGELPASLKVKGLKLRYFFKRALREFLPPETIAKTKHGFGMPFGLWLKEHRLLAELVDDSLRDFQRRGIVRASYLQQLRRQHESDHPTYFGVMLWVIMMLERWLAAHKL